MFDTEDRLEGQVRSLRFQALDEDAQDHRGHHNSNNSNNNNNNNDNNCSHQTGVDAGAGSLRRRPRALKPNFSLEYSYPAVVLEDICFQVDRSQQQANFLSECIFRINSTLAPLCASGATELDEPHRSQKVQILKSVNLSVPCGSIFGLLGPSSCGKTTLLRCLLGLLTPSSGSIRLFGKQKSGAGPAATTEGAEGTCAEGLFCCGDPSGGPRERWWLRRRARRCDEQADWRVPGPGVGYMPQDLGLYEDFTIGQLLSMFGRYMRMEAELIAERIEFMASFLELPDVGRQVQTLSGGQKRRVSFAIACLHMPPLIILDEPTVGVDPLLRRSIWKYLRRLASEENRTIIITTHYIEEAAQADQVALMRAGEVLVQDTPRNIMRSNNSGSLEEAFLKICNNVGAAQGGPAWRTKSSGRPEPPSIRLLPQPQLNWLADKLADEAAAAASGRAVADPVGRGELPRMTGPRWEAPQRLAPFDDKLGCDRHQPLEQQQQRRRQTRGAVAVHEQRQQQQQLQLHHCDRLGAHSDEFARGDALAVTSHDAAHDHRATRREINELLLLQGARLDRDNQIAPGGAAAAASKPAAAKMGTRRILSPRKSKFTLNDERRAPASLQQLDVARLNKARDSWRTRTKASLGLYWALLYKNYRRNVNSIPLLVFQFMLPMIQMISFCLCVGGRPTQVGLGIVNHDQPLGYGGTAVPGRLPSGSLLHNLSLGHDLESATTAPDDEPLSSRYLSFLDRSMLAPRPYDNLSSALADVRRSKLWAVLEIGENFTSAMEKRFDLENFYQLDLDTIGQSIIRIYPDRSNKILDMICHRSLVDSFRAFLANEFEHFRRLPLEIGRPIFEIKPNVISNSIDGYTESIAPGLLASLTYIMAAGLTTFIMVVERSDGILERTYTSGINPVSYLLAHAIFRSLVMMLQIALVLVLTFYVLKQPLVGSIWLAYAMLMVLNITGISYGLLISSIVTDQNGAALTIVSSLVVKITLSGILWPFEAIPYWLRAICYVQPLTMPVQALKSITLKGATLGDASVNLGFLVSLTWLLVFLTISTKRFKFYQH